MSKSPDHYEKEGNTLAEQGLFLDAAKAFESAAGACLGANRASRYDEVAEMMRTIHSSGVNFYLAGKVQAAYQAALNEAKPFVPSHAQIASHMQEVVKELLALPLESALTVLRTQRRVGTWDQFVVESCKAAWREAGRI